MEGFTNDWNLQACGCDAISSLVDSLPDDGDLIEEVVEARVPIVTARALERCADDNVGCFVLDGWGLVGIAESLSLFSKWS